MNIHTPPPILSNCSFQRGQASLEFIFTLLVLVCLLTLLALPTARLLQSSLRASQTNAQDLSLSQTSLNLGILSASGSGLSSIFMPAGFQSDGPLIRSAPVPSSSAPTIAPLGQDSNRPTYGPSHDVPT